MAKNKFVLLSLFSGSAVSAAWVVASIMLLSVWGAAAVILAPVCVFGAIPIWQFIGAANPDDGALLDFHPKILSAVTKIIAVLLLVGVTLIFIDSFQDRLWYEDFPLLLDSIAIILCGGAYYIGVFFRGREMARK